MTTYEVTIEFEDGEEFQERLGDVLRHLPNERWDVTAADDGKRATIAQQPLRRDGDQYVPAEEGEAADVREGEFYTVRVDGGDDENALDVARSENNRVNDMLADTDGDVCTMTYSGQIGYHVNIATGETDPEYLWRVALLQALDETMFEPMWIDAETPAGATAQPERQLGDTLHSAQLSWLCDAFQENLEGLIDAQDRAGGPDAEEGQP